MRIGISVGPFGKIPVEGSHDGVRPERIIRLPFPLTDARSAGIGHYGCSRCLEIGYHSVTDGSAVHLFRPRIHQQRRSHLQSLILQLTDQRSRTTQILIRRVGARTDESDLHATGIPVRLYFCRKFRQWAGRIRCERTVQIRFQSREVNLNHPVVILFGLRIHLRIRLQVGSHLRGQCSHFLPAGRTQISRHFLVIREQ